jgi:hypothetical protein
VVDSSVKKAHAKSCMSFSDRTPPRPAERPSVYRTDGFCAPTGTDDRPPIPSTSNGVSPCAVAASPSSRQRSSACTGHR